MADEFASKVVSRFTGEIASRPNKASALASAAEKLGSEGLTQHSFDTLLDIETLISGATALLNAASIARRSDPEEHRSG